MASDIKIVYHNNVFAGSGAPADGDLLTRDNSSHPKDSVYIDRDSGVTYVRKDTTLVAATDWQPSAPSTALPTATVSTYAAMQASITADPNTKRDFFISADETNGGEFTRYYYNGTDTFWIIMQTI
jgi:hypothetical protein